MLKSVAMSLIVVSSFVSLLPAQEGPDPEPVVVLNNARFEPIVRDLVVPAGEVRRFEIRSAGFARASILVGGSTVPAAGPVRLLTLYGPPQVLSGEPQRLIVDREGMLHGKRLEPVLGPHMTVVIQNASSADATIDLSAYLTN